jgi:glycosyltransferase involved in cell wall biosynthesis
LIDDYGVSGDRIQVLAPGAARGFFDTGRMRLLSSKSDSNHKRIKILFVGGDFERKGGLELLNCMSGAVADACELHVVTQSAVPARPNLFVYRGLKSNSPELQQLYADADIFALPTLADCLGVALMEAAASALPVVTTNVGGVGEAVQPGQSGIVVRSGDVSSLRSALSALAGDSQLRCRMGQAAHRLACERFDSERNNQVLFDLLASLAHERRVGC